jgi:hypothetical protein
LTLFAAGKHEKALALVNEEVRKSYHLPERLGGPASDDFDFIQKSHSGSQAPTHAHVVGRLLRAAAAGKVELDVLDNATTARRAYARLGR